MTNGDQVDETRTLAFAGFVLDARARTLRAPDGRLRQLPARAFDVLCILVCEGGRTVGKDVLLAEAWPGRVVEENTLTQAVSAVRRALADTGEAGRRLIVTVPGYGYRFTAPVSVVPASAVSVRAPLRWPMAAFPVALLAATLALGVAHWRAQVDLAGIVEPWPVAGTPVADPGCAGASAEAHRALRSGRMLFDKFGPRRFEEARHLLERAVTLDPACASAHAVLAQLYVSWATLADGEPGEARRRAEASLRRATAIDPELAEVHLARARIALWFDWDSDTARASTAQALARDPDLPEAQLMAVMLQASHAPETESLARIGRAGRLAPVSPRVLTTWAAFVHGVDPVRAEGLIEDALRLEPGFWAATFERASWALADGRHADAVADYAAAAEDSARSSLVLAHLARAHLARGEEVEALSLLEELQHRRLSRYVPATIMAGLHSDLGDHDAALDEVERAFAERDVRLWFASQSRSLAALREHPRFRAVNARVEALARAKGNGTSP